jgi:hypothetical protein
MVTRVTDLEYTQRPTCLLSAQCYYVFAFAKAEIRHTPSQESFGMCIYLEFFWKASVCQQLLRHGETNTEYHASSCSF